VLDQIRQLVLAILRVPPEPQLPEGTPESVLIFRAGRNFYRWQVLAWGFSHLGVVVGAIFAYYFTWRLVALGPPWLRLMYRTGEVLGLFAVAIALPVTFFALRWSYELRWYIVTDHSLRTRRGVWNVEEITMTFANIQEVRVTSGPIQNALGIADVKVHSAGGGAGTPHSQQAGHAAVFEGVEHANEIRDRIVERLRAYRDLGLGGGEHAQSQIAGAPDAALIAARSVLEEAKALRKVWQQPST